MIEEVGSEAYDEVVRVWWSSVLTTHHFIDRSYLEEIKSKLKAEYLPQVRLIVWRGNHSQIQGFLGLGESTIEMLFVDPDHSGKGIGKHLLSFAIDNNCHLADVNEANESAIRFYKKQSFQQISRSELDGAGKSYPILHLKYTP